MSPTVIKMIEDELGRKLTTQDLATALVGFARLSTITSLEMWGSDWKVTVRIKKAKVKP